MAAPSYVGTGSAFIVATTTAPPYPSGLASGDILVLFAASDSTATPSDPAGWTKLGSTTTGGGFTVTLWTKVATGSETGSQSVSGFTNGNYGVSWIVAYRPATGGNTITPTLTTGVDSDSSSTAVSMTGSSWTVAVDQVIAAFEVALAAQSTPTFVGAGVLTANNAGTTIAPAYPAGVAANDICVVQYAYNAATTFSTPTGWTLLGTSVNDANLSTATFWRRYVAADAVPSTTVTTQSNTNGGYGRIYAFRGCYTGGTPVEGVGNAGTPTLSTTPASSACTTTGNNRLVVCLVALDDDNTWSSGMPPTGWTNRGGILSSTTGGDAGIDAVSIEQATPGTVPSATVGTQSASDYWRTTTFALIPAALTSHLFSPTLANAGATLSVTGRFGSLTANNSVQYTHYDGAVTAGGTGAPSWSGTSTVLSVTGITAFVRLAEGSGASPQTWTGSTGSIEVTGTSSSFTPDAVTWTGSTGSITVAGASGTFTPGTSTWTGATGSVQVAGTSGSWVSGAVVWTGSGSYPSDDLYPSDTLYPTVEGAVHIVGTSGTFTSSSTWTGGTGTIQVTGTSGTFTPGTAVWAGSTGSIEATGTSGSFIPGAVTWVGGNGAVEVTATSGAFTAGAVTWVGGNGSVDIVGTSGSFVLEGGPQTWTGTTGAITFDGVSGTFVAGAVTWDGSTGTIEASGTSGTFTPGTVTWDGGTGVVEVTGASGTFTAGAITWTGSTGSIEVAGTSGAFTAGSVTWDGTAGTVHISGLSGTFVAGDVTWSGAVGVIQIDGVSGVFIGFAFGPVGRVSVTWAQPTSTATWAEPSTTTGWALTQTAVVWAQPVTRTTWGLTQTASEFV